MMDEKFQCCICGKAIDLQNEPNISLVAIKNWFSSQAQPTEQYLFCHEDCFKKVLCDPKLYYLHYL